MHLRMDPLSLDDYCNKHKIKVAEDSFLLKSKEYQMFIAANKQVMRLSELWNNSQPVVYARFTCISHLCLS